MKYLDLARQVLTIRSQDGAELNCLCPYPDHNDHAPSFRFNADKGLFICFGCGVKGSASRLSRDFGGSLPLGEGTGPDDLNVQLMQALELMEPEHPRTLATCTCASVYESAHEQVSGKLYPGVPLIRSGDISRETLDKSEVDPPNNPIGISKDPGRDKRQVGRQAVLPHLSSSTGNKIMKSDLPSVITTGSDSGSCDDCGRELVLPENYLNRYMSSSSEIDDYWTRTRGLHSAVVDLFQLGFSPVRRSGTMPYRTPDSLLLGVVHRHLHGTPRYRYPRGFPRSKTLFGLHAVANVKVWEQELGLRGLNLDRAALPENWVVVCEGPVDALKLWSAGLPAVAMWGSSMSPQQADLLVRAGVSGAVVFCDRDATGRKARAQVSTLLGSRNLFVRKVGYPRGYPSSFSDPGALSSSFLRTRVRHARWHWTDRRVRASIPD